MKLKKKIIPLILCSLMVFSFASCSCGGDGETPEKDTPVATQYETNEKGETVVVTQADNQQDEETSKVDETTGKSDEKTDSNTDEKSDNEDTKTEGSDSKSDKKPDKDKAHKSDKTEETKGDSQDGTSAEGEDPLYDAQAEFGDKDWDF